MGDATPRMPSRRPKALGTPLTWKSDMLFTGGTVAFAKEP